MALAAAVAFLVGVLFAGQFAKGAELSQKAAGVVALVLGSLSAGVVFWATSGDDPPPRPPMTATEKRQARIAAQFSVWNGAHRNLEAAVRASMNDPNSYEHIETRYQDRGDHLFLVMKFRGANVFGGKVINMVSAEADLDGRVLNVETIDP